MAKCYVQFRFEVQLSLVQRISRLVCVRSVFLGGQETLDSIFDSARDESVLWSQMADSFAQKTLEIG